LPQILVEDVEILGIGLLPNPLELAGLGMEPGFEASLRENPSQDVSCVVYADEFKGEGFLALDKQ
jgi:hypothetical protein